MFLSRSNLFLSAAAPKACISFSRTVSCTAASRCSKITAAAAPKSSARLDMREMENLSKGQKMYMMLSGKYRTMSEIPDTMPAGSANAVMARARIGASLMSFLVVFCGIGWAVVTGKRHAAAGDSTYKRGLQMHDDVIRQRDEKAAAAAKAQG